MSDRGLLFILCGPSGVGKTTLAHHLLELHSELGFSVSYTTRPPREGEVDGVDYHFVSTGEFQRMREEEAFAEWAQVHGNYYGTGVTTIESAWAADRNLIFDIDYQGAKQLQERYPGEAVAVLVTPPSMKELEARLRGRETDSEEVIARRLQGARHELEQWEIYDYAVENAELEAARRDVDQIYRVALMQTRFLQDKLRHLLSRDGD